MTSNYYTLAFLAANLDATLRGKAIEEAFTQDKNELVISFAGLPGKLVISCLTGTNTLYLHPNFSRSRRNSTDVLTSLPGKAILSVAIQPADRVVSFSLSDGMTIHACFFGSKANVLLVDSESRIVDAFKQSRTIAGEKYTPAGGETIHDIAALRTLASQEPDEKIVTLLRHAMPVLGTTLATEVLFRSNITATSRAKDLTREKLDMVEQCLAMVLTELAMPAPRVYVSREADRTPYRFSLVRLEHCHGFDERHFPDVHDGIRFFISRTRSTHDLQSRSKGVLDALQQKKAKLQRNLAAVEADLEGASRADEYDRYARLLMANLGPVPPGATSIALEEDGRSNVTVPLDPTLSLVRNAQRYFEKAKKSRLAYEQSGKRVLEMRKSLLATEELMTAANAIQSPGSLKGFLADHAAELEKVGIGEKAQQREQLPFRVFTVDGGYEVWAGKSSRNNDELTMRYTKPNDLWFHARGASGSHVVLKAGSGKGEPSKKAKEQAAGIAAYYSKMRNAKMVPVAMTERKYVRKPRGVSPGTVVLEREKVVFAEPALPQS